VVTILEELVFFNTSKNIQVLSILLTLKMHKDTPSPQELVTSSSLEKERNQLSHSSLPEVSSSHSKKKEKRESEKITDLLMNE
jgi:phosphoketolase